MQCSAWVLLVVFIATTIAGLVPVRALAADAPPVLHRWNDIHDIGHEYTPVQGGCKGSGDTYNPYNCNVPVGATIELPEETLTIWENDDNKNNGGYCKDFQPFLSYTYGGYPSASKTDATPPPRGAVVTSLSPYPGMTIALDSVKVSGAGCHVTASAKLRVTTQWKPHWTRQVNVIFGMQYTYCNHDQQCYGPFESWHWARTPPTTISYQITTAYDLKPSAPPKPKRNAIFTAYLVTPMRSGLAGKQLAAVTSQRKGTDGSENASSLLAFQALPIVSQGIGGSAASGAIARNMSSLETASVAETIILTVENLFEKIPHPNNALPVTVAIPVTADEPAIEQALEENGLMQFARNLGNLATHEGSWTDLGDGISASLERGVRKVDFRFFGNETPADLLSHLDFRITKEAIESVGVSDADEAAIESGIAITEAPVINRVCRTGKGGVKVVCVAVPVITATAVVVGYHVYQNAAAEAAKAKSAAVKKLISVSIKTRTSAPCNKDKPSEILGERLRAVKDFPPDETPSKKTTNYAAHHIVAAGAKLAEAARKILEKRGIKIDINDAVNGVWLPCNCGSKNPKGRVVHQKLHTKAYYEWVNDQLRTATTREQVIATLRRIKKLLLENKLPPELGVKPCP